MKTPRGTFREPVKVKIGSGQTEYALRVEDGSGNLLLDIDELGKLDTKVFVVQEPPDTGTPGDPVTNVHPYGLFIDSDDPVDDPIRVRSAGVTRLRVRAGTNGILELVGADASDVPITLIESSGAPGDLIQLWDNPFNELRFRLLSSGVPVIAQHSAPADGDLSAGDCALWFDQTNGAPRFKLKAKQADGTVVTGTVVLA